MRLLLDTHAALWWWRGADQLPASARTAIEDAAVIHVSPASAWEVATKFRRGRLPDIGDPAERFPALMERHAFSTLPITQEHALRAGSLAGEHGDPFDRMIAAQALTEDLAVVTRDRQIAAFGCRTLW